MNGTNIKEIKENIMKKENSKKAEELKILCNKYRTLRTGVRIKQKLLFFQNISEKASPGHTDCGS